MGIDFDFCPLKAKSALVKLLTFISRTIAPYLPNYHPTNSSPLAQSLVTPKRPFVRISQTSI